MNGRTAILVVASILGLINAASATTVYLADDFSATALDTTKWDYHYGGGSTVKPAGCDIVIENQRLHLYGSQGPFHEVGIWSKDTFTSPFHVSFDVEDPSSEDAAYYAAFGLGHYANRNWQINLNPTGVASIKVKVAGAWTLANTFAFSKDTVINVDFWLNADRNETLLRVKEGASSQDILFQHDVVSNPRPYFFIQNNVADRTGAYYDNIVVDDAPVPEPGTMLLVGLGASFCVVRRRRKMQMTNH